MLDLIIMLLMLSTITIGVYYGAVFSSLALTIFVASGLMGLTVATILGLPPRPVFVVIGLIGATAAMISSRRYLPLLREHLDPIMNVIDRVVGAAVLSLLMLFFVWLVAAKSLIAPAPEPHPAFDMNSSVIGSLLLDAVSPSSGKGAQIVRSGVFFPQLDTALVIAEPPDAEVVHRPAVVQAQNSVLQVKARACGMEITGTGWVAAPNLVVTNAHVVAGHSALSLDAGAGADTNAGAAANTNAGTGVSVGPNLSGAQISVVAFNELYDIAVLWVQGVTLPPALPLRFDVVSGDSAVAIGYPRGGARQLSPARVDRVSQQKIAPLTGGEPQPILVLGFRGVVQQGNSGGPLVDELGRVLGVVVSKGLSQNIDTAYGIASAQLQPFISAAAQGRSVHSGRCLAAHELVS